MSSVRAVQAILLSLFLLPLAASAPPDDDAHPAQFAVGFERPSSLQAGDRFAGGDVVRADPALGFVVVHAQDATAFEAQARHTEGVRYVEADPVQQLELLSPNDPRYAGQYGLGLVGAPSAWDTTVGATTVKLCIVDTGVRYTHEDIAPHWIGGTDVVNGDGDAWDDRGHGTHVTGIAAGVTNNAKGGAGVAGVGILHAKVLDVTGSGTWTNVASGIRWCADQGAAVVSLSLGGTTGSSTLQSAVDYAWSKGAVVVAASGNDGCSGCIRYPAKYANAMAVGCVDSARNLCSFTSTGSELDIAAPGYSIDSTYYTNDTSYVKMSGTSMSTPFVAGAAALLKSAKPTLTASDIRAALEQNAQDLGAAGWDASFGRGLVHVGAAMTAVMTGASSPPPPPPAPARSVSLTPDAASQSVQSGREVVYRVTVTNTGSATDSFTLTTTGGGSGWRVSLSATSLTLAAGASATVDLTLKAPRSHNQVGSFLVVDVRAVSTADATKSDTTRTTTTIV